jgi:hypothetical protein
MNNSDWLIKWCSIRRWTITEILWYLKFQCCMGDKLPPGSCNEGNGFSQVLLSSGTCNFKLSPHLECTLICNIQGVSFMAGLPTVERTTALTYGDWWNYRFFTYEFSVLLKKKYSVLTKSILFISYLRLNLPDSLFGFTCLKFLRTFKFPTHSTIFSCLFF